MAKANSKRALVMAAAVGTALSSSNAATTGWNQTAAGTYSYNDPANWVGGNVNGIWDSSLTLAGAQTITFSDNMTLASPWLFNYLGKFNVTLRSDGTANRTLTLGTDMVVNPVADTYVIVGSGSANQGFAINLGGASRTFDVQSGGNRFLDIRNTISGTNVTDGVIKTGAGVLYYNNGVDSTYTGETSVSGGTLWMSSTSRATGSDFTVSNGGTLRFDSSGSGMSSMPRTKSLTLSNGNMTGTASTTTSANTNDQMGALTVGGASTITLTPTALRNMQMTASSLARNAGGSLLIKGTALGVNALTPATVNAANFVVTEAPTLDGAGPAGSASAAFIKGVFGDTSATGVGSAAATGGLVTYDAAKGVRLLDTATEYENRDTSGSITTTSNNVRVTGAASENRTMTIASEGTTSVGSLTLVYTGSTVGGSGVTIDGATTGTGTLQVNTGVIQVGGALAASTAGISSTDGFYIKTATLDLNGTEGMIRSITPTTTTGTIQTAARVYLNTAIANDGGNGVTFSSGGTQGPGAGMVTLGGSAANTYTGSTTLNGGILSLAKPAGTNAIPGDLVLNSGSIYLANHNQISDAADVTINGGALYFADANNSGTGRGDTFAGLTMTGGATSPASANGQTIRVTGNANLSGGTFNAISNGKVTVDGSVTLSGGKLNVGGSGSPSSFGSLTTVGGLSITNIGLGSYTPITINGGSANRGGKLVLGGNVSFTGNTANSNAVTIAAASATNPGVIALEGTRTFDIGDGAALSDLIVQPALVDGAVSVGGLTKAGLGTLVLTGASTYTGNTIVSGGVLALGATGSIAASPRIEITAGASLDTTAQSFAMLGSQTFAFGVDGAGAGSAGLLDAGALDISAGTIEFVTVATLDDEAYVLASYTSLTGTFAAVPTVPGYAIDYSYQGNNIALVSAIPEPGTIALASTVAGFALSMRRRRTA